MPEWNGEWHPYAERFRMRSEAEIRMLAEDIEENGQAAPCVMTKDGIGLDGRNRVAACRIAGIEPEWVVYEGLNLVARIMSLNLGSRDYTTGQKAMMTAIGLVEQGRRENSRWEYGAVSDARPDGFPESGKSWSNAVNQAGIILDHRPDLVDQVILGDTALSSAYEQATKKRDEDKARTKALATLPADLAALVEAKVRDIDDAVQEAKDRTTVADIDDKRTADGAPPPTFAERVADGNLSWAEARKLADEWVRERKESIARDRDRIIKVTDGWAAIEDIAANPTKPYTSAVLEELQPARREAIQRILNQIGGTA